MQNLCDKSSRFPLTTPTSFRSVITYKVGKVRQGDMKKGSAPAEPFFYFRIYGQSDAHGKKGYPIAVQPMLDRGLMNLQ